MPYSVAQFQVKHGGSFSHSERHTAKFSTVNSPSAANEITQSATSTRPSHLPTSILEVDAQLEAKKNSNDYPAKEEGPSIGHISRTTDKTTWPKRGPSELPSLSEVAGGEGDLLSEEANSQPIKNMQQAQKQLGVPDPKANWSTISLSKISQNVKSYVEVEGDWVPSGGKTPFRDFESSQSLESSVKDSQTVGDSAKSAHPRLRNGVKPLRNVTNSTSFQCPKSGRHPAEHSRTEGNASRETPNFPAEAPQTAINIDGAKLLAELELFLAETGTIRAEKKPIKFKDAIGRKFLFPFELAATWAVSIINGLRFVQCRD